jgi:hypothetical protein
MNEDITEHVAYDRGLNEGLERGKRESNRIIAIKEDLAFEKGYDAGKKFAQKKVIELMDEVIAEYKTHVLSEKMDSESSRLPKAQHNAVEFMKSWVLSGGQTDFDGNRVCLPW